MIPKRDAKPLAPALDAGLDIMELLALKKEAGFNELCKTLHVSKASVARLLKTLAARGYIRKDEERDKWLPGPKMGMAGFQAPVSEILLAESGKALEAYVDATGNTAICAYWNGNEFQVLSKVQREGAMSMLDVGRIVRDLSKYPWGWLFYLSLDAAGRKAASKLFEAPELFKSRIAAWSEFIDGHGYALDDHEIFQNSRRMGAPIHDSAGRVVGALGTSGNRLSMPDSELEAIAHELVRRAEELSKAITAARPA